MGRFGLSVRAFFRVLSDGDFADQVRRLADGQPALEAPAAPSPPVAPAAPPRPEIRRSDALNLLAALQREARLVDFLKEDLSAATDAQIGAAVRNVHRDSAAVLERALALRPVMAEAEGAAVQVPAGSDAGRVRLVGNVTGQPPYRGALRHGGWEATKLQLPEWSGTNDAAALVVAPAEVELP